MSILTGASRRTESDSECGPPPALDRSLVVDHSQGGRHVIEEHALLRRCAEHLQNDNLGIGPPHASMMDDAARLLVGVPEGLPARSQSRRSGAGVLAAADRDYGTGPSLQLSSARTSDNGTLSEGRSRFWPRIMGGGAERPFEESAARGISRLRPDRHIKGAGKRFQRRLLGCSVWALACCEAVSTEGPVCRSSSLRALCAQLASDPVINPTAAPAATPARRSSW